MQLNNYSFIFFHWISERCGNLVDNSRDLGIPVYPHHA